MIDKVVNFEHDILIPKCDVYIKNVIQSQGKWEKTYTRHIKKY
jgi:hypothetical protein